MKDPKILKIENLHTFLEVNGLEVVSGSWLHGHQFPVLLVRPIVRAYEAPDYQASRVCRCGHGAMAHDDDGLCLVVGCTCNLYYPRSERSQL